MKRKEIGGACGTHGEKETGIQGLVGNLWERDHMEDLGID